MIKSTLKTLRCRIGCVYLPITKCCASVRHAITSFINPLKAFTMDRGERREIKERKWTSKLKKMYQGGWKKFLKVKTSGKKPDQWSEAESFRDLEESKKGVKYKNTGTIERDAKQFGAKEQHKRDLQNRSLTAEQQQELDEVLERDV